MRSNKVWNDLMYDTALYDTVQYGMVLYGHMQKNTISHQKTIIEYLSGYLLMHPNQIRFLADQPALRFSDNTVYIVVRSLKAESSNSKAISLKVSPPPLKKIFRLVSRSLLTTVLLQYSTVQYSTG